MSVAEGMRYVSRTPLGRSWQLLVLVGAVVLLAGCTTGDPATATRTPSTTTGSVAASTDAPGSTAAPTGAPDSTATTAAAGENRTVVHAPTATLGKGDQPAALESRLYGLVTAENRTAYADSRRLDLRNGSVRVVVELRDGAELPASFDLTVESRYERLVQVFAPVDGLVPLADHGNVSYVRTPREAQPGEPSLHPIPQWLIHNSPGESSRSRSYCC